MGTLVMLPSIIIHYLRLGISSKYVVPRMLLNRMQENTTNSTEQIYIMYVVHVAFLHTRPFTMLLLTHYWYVKLYKQKQLRLQLNTLLKFMSNIKFKYLSHHQPCLFTDANPVQACTLSTALI